ncbi:MAG: zinc-ribbon domain-containing protein [Smithellaceae bacterium]
MIIQCSQCRTKYRFADELMEGDGIWMRCSRCQHVFFQENPHIKKPGGEPAAREEQLAEDKTLSLHRPPVSSEDESAELFLDDVMRAKKESEKEIMPEIEKPINEEIFEDEDDTAYESAMEFDRREAGKSSRKKTWKILAIAAWIIAAIVVIPAIIYYFVFPQMGDRLLKVVSQYVDIGIREPARPEVVAGQIKLQDIRQRILNNFMLGQIRVVEGTAVNQADYPVSRIVVKGEIVDAYAVVLGERAAYAGNVLTDEELTSLPEEAIFSRLSIPEGSNNSNDKIAPNGMIPFMIVFVREPAGVIKTTVKTAGAERLLSN